MRLDAFFAIGKFCKALIALGSLFLVTRLVPMTFDQNVVVFISTPYLDAHVLHSSLRPFLSFIFVTCDDQGGSSRTPRARCSQCMFVLYLVPCVLISS